MRDRDSVTVAIPNGVAQHVQAGVWVALRLPDWMASPLPTGVVPPL